MKLRKLLALLMAMVLVVGMLSACGKDDSTTDNKATDKPTDKATEAPDDKDGADESSSKGEDVEITWMFWDDLEATEDLMTKQYKATIDRFNEADNGYKVKTLTTNLDEYFTKLNALVGTADMPDVFICDPGPRLTAYVDNGVAMDLTDVLKEDAAWKDSFTDNIFNAITYEDKIMAVPTNFASSLVYYNTEIFEEVGVEVPKTWKEFIDVCKKIKDESDYAPLTISAGTNWCLGMLAGYLCDRAGGPDNLNGILDGSVKWTDDTYVNAMEKMLEVKDYLQDSYLGDSNDQATANFYNGDAAMLIQGSWAIAQINGENPDMEEKCGVFQFPELEGGSDPNRWVIKTDNMVVNKDTKNVEACIALLKEFTSEQAQKDTAEIAGKMPVTKVEVDYSKAPKQLEYVQECMKTLTGTLGFYNESLQSEEAGNEFNNTAVSIMMGEVTVKEGLENLQKFFEDKVYE